ncbi:MAG: amidohydrolase family protein [Eubacteriales bacterium]|jgi:dihydroorotase
MKLDIILRNGTLFTGDSQPLFRADLGIAGRYIESIGDLSNEHAPIEIDCSDFVITPGLIDFHIHLFDEGSDHGTRPDVVLLPSGVTSAVEGGTCGVCTYRSFHKFIIPNTFASIKSYLNVSSTGILTYMFHENPSPQYYEEEKILDMVAQYPEIIALKLRLSLDLDPHMTAEPLERSLRMAEKAKVPLVVHVTNPPIPSEDILSLLRPGDVFCHCFHGKGNTLLNERGTLKEAAWAARKRGVIFDACNGQANYSHQVAQAAIAEGFYPDVISTDMSRIPHTIYKEPAISLPHILSKYLALGMELPDVLHRATTAPASLAKWTDRGKLQPHMLADISVFQLVNRPVQFYDFANNVLSGEQLLVPQVTIKEGTIYYRQLTTF